MRAKAQLESSLAELRWISNFWGPEMAGCGYARHKVSPLPPACPRYKLGLFGYKTGMAWLGFGNSCNRRENMQCEVNPQMMEDLQNLWREYFARFSQSDAV